MPRPRIYEDVDKEMKLEELVKMACDLFGPYPPNNPPFPKTKDPRVQTRGSISR